MLACLSKWSSLKGSNIIDVFQIQIFYISNCVVSLSKGLHSPNSSQTLTTKTQNRFNLSIFFTFILQVLQGPAEVKRRNDGIQPFANMKKEELINECYYRGLPAGDILKLELEKNLKEHLAGTVRVPAMVFNNQNSSLADLNLWLCMR